MDLCKIEYFALTMLFIACHAFADGMDGEFKGSRFYPKAQAYMVINAKFDDLDKVPIDVRGVPVILRGSKIYFTENYFTLKDINSGSTIVVSSCFEQVGNSLIIKPAGRLVDYIGKQLILNNVDGHWMMPYGDRIQMKLNEIPLPDDFDSTKKRFDLSHNLYLSKGYGRNRDCKPDKVEGIQLNNKIVKLIYEDLGQEKVIEDGMLDPDTPIRSGSMSYENRITLDETIRIGRCQGSLLIWRYAMGKYDWYQNEKSFFYLISALIGKHESEKHFCHKIKDLKKVYMENISEPYDVKEKPGKPKFRFSRWVGDYGVVVRHGRSKRDFFITGIDSETLRISEIPFDVETK
ncbi:MAG: hypothetical protein ABW152_08515 [Candidatus Thiodiazotropha endolucinida]